MQISCASDAGACALLCNVGNWRSGAAGPARLTSSPSSAFLTVCFKRLHRKRRRRRGRLYNSTKGQASASRVHFNTGDTPRGLDPTRGEAPLGRPPRMFPYVAGPAIFILQPADRGGRRGVSPHFELNPKPRNAEAPPAIPRPGRCGPSPACGGCAERSERVRDGLHVFVDEAQTAVVKLNPRSGAITGMRIRRGVATTALIERHCSRVVRTECGRFPYSRPCWQPWCCKRDLCPNG